MQVSGAFNALFRAGLRKDFRDTYQKYPPQYSQFLKTGTHDTPEMQAAIITGFSRFVELQEGDPIPLDVPKISPVVQAVDREWGLGYMITRRAVEDDQYGKANQGSKWLAESAMLTEEYRSAELLDDAFAGAVYKGIDGLPLLHPAHTLLNSTATVSNQPVGAQIELSVAGLTALQHLAMTLKNENGDPIQSRIDKLIVGNSATVYNRIRQIIGSEKEPFTADNQDNAMKMEFGNIKPIVSVYKTSTTSYFGVDSSLNDAHFLMRRTVTFDDDFDIIQQAAIYVATMRFLIWFVDWRGWYGMNPS